jgi:LuxR family maltose regulon positive regulatory protein
MKDYSELADKEYFRIFYQNFGAIPYINKIINEGAAAISSGLLLEQNRLPEALKKALYAKSVIHKSSSKDIIFSIYIHIAAIYAAMGNYGAYQDAVTDAENHITGTKAYQFMPNFKAYTARHYIQRGSCDAAKEWLSNYFITEMKEPELYKLYQYTTSARAYLVLGDLEKTFEYVSKLKKLCEDFQRPLDTAEAWTLFSIIHWKRGNREEAVSALETALLYLQPHSFIRPVADEGESVLPILKIFRQSAERKSYDGQLDAKYIHRVYLAAHEQARRVSGLLPAPDIMNIKLTKQQQKIICLLADGNANAEMMEITGLTLHTIRTHTMGAYKKLGVDNAADAVLKAKLLGIIN